MTKVPVRLVQVSMWLLVSFFASFTLAATTFNITPGMSAAAIQETLNEMLPSDTANWAAGTYDVGEIRVRAGTMTAGSGTILKGQFTVTGNGVEIDGFTIQPSSNFATSYGIRIQSSANIHNNIIQNHSTGIAVNGTATNIYDNTISNNSNWGILINDQFGYASNLRINSNNIQNNSTGGIGLTNAATLSSDVTIIDNSISGNGMAIRVTNTRDVQILNNIVSNSGEGIELAGGNTRMTITGNRVSVGQYGVQLSGTNSSVQIHKNNFVDLSTAGLSVDRLPDSSATFATCNFWGDDSGPLNATSNPNGKGTKIVGLVEVPLNDYSPWNLTGGACTGTPDSGPTPPPPTPAPGLAGIWQETFGNRCIQISENLKVAQTYKKCGPLTCKRQFGKLTIATSRGRLKDENVVARIVYARNFPASQDLELVQSGRLRVREEYDWGPIDRTKRKIYHKVDRCRYRLPRIPIPRPHPKPKPAPEPSPTPKPTPA
ncbi:right-handed parallel beta-helix repeat-containing protein [Bdellovibrio sp. HCB288]|uniref:right-handed parallel beta-helix repeat-containing protein n=1 Tax=Bdellovibrio sp. HCB288 TaxID=3394355 RepID=UPI0039B6DF80